MLIRYGDEPQLSEFTLLCNTEDGGLVSNVTSSSRRGLPEVDEVKPHGIPAVICGGGPSLEDTLETIRSLQSCGAHVFALNGTASFLTQNGIRPDYQIILDPRPINVKFIEQRWATELLLCSQVHPDLFDHAAKIGYPVTLWHPAIQGIEKHIPQDNPLLVSVSLSVGLSSLSLIHTLGYRELHLFGYDSSHRQEKSHAYEQAWNASDEIVRCCVDSQVFYSSMSMAGQANQFRQLTDMVQKFGAKVHVYGSGLVPAMWKSWQREKAVKPLTAVYDLGVSPPSYDFLSFLISAEKHRRENGFTCIDVMFQPGPMHGFRDDELPPDSETRNGMLWRVCAGMARLLPSVRNIDIKTTRWHVQGDVFPPEYQEDRPVAWYATALLKDGEPMLKASEYAKKQVALRFSRPYATISLREATHWTTRNSNRAAWSEVANWLKANNLLPVVIPDTEGNGIDGFSEFPAASFDIDLRAALYEGAAINLGVLNGPMSLCAFLDCRYLIFNVGGDDTAAGSTHFLNAHGFKVGDGFGGNGRLIWEKDDVEVILRELQEFAVKPKERITL